MEKRPITKILRDSIFYFLVAMLIRFLRLLPRMTAIRLMRFLGGITFTLAGKARGKTIRHLSMAFDKEKSAAEINLLARRTFVHFFTAAADLLRLPKLMDRGLDKIVTTEGMHHLDEAFTAGRGALMITAHYGNWEVLGAWLGLHEYPIKVVGTALFDPRLDKILVETRNKAGYTNIARGKGTREILRTLKEGKAVGMLIDQDTNVPGVFVTFFGMPTHTPTGPVVLARKLKLPIIPIFMHMKSDFTYHITCYPPVEQIRTDDEMHDIQVNTQRCSDIYEKVIRLHPEQWVWMHKRWMTRPLPGDPVPPVDKATP